MLPQLKYCERDLGVSPPARFLLSNILFVFVPKVAYGFPVPQLVEYVSAKNLVLAVSAVASIASCTISRASA